MSYNSKIRIVHVILRYYPAITGESTYLKELLLNLNSKCENIILTTKAFDADSIYDPFSKSIQYHESTVDGIQVHYLDIKYKNFLYPFIKMYIKLHSKNRYILNVEELAQIQNNFIEDFKNRKDKVKMKYIPPFINGLKEMIKIINPDVIHIMGPITSIGRYGYKISKELGIPYVVTPSFHLMQPYYYNLQLAEILRSASHIYTMTEAQKSFFKSLGMNENKITTVGAPIDVEKFRRYDLSNVSERMKSYFKKYENHHHFLFLGRLQPDKGLDFYLKIASELEKHDNYNITFHIAGAKYKPFHSKLKSQISKVSNIKFWGQVNDNEKKFLLSNSECLIFPSYADSLGVVYLEAWAFKIPVIGTYNPSTVDIITQSKGGLIIEFNNLEDAKSKLFQLINSKEERLQYATNGYNFVVKNFSPKYVASKFIDGIRQITMIK